MSRIIILTTPTSGTSSLWRIVCNFLPNSWDKNWFIDDCLNRGVPFNEINQQKLPEHGCYLFNQPHLFNFDQDFSNTRFIINLRDPRDMSCNQYYWIFSHPNLTGGPDEVHERRKLEIKANGIDKHALSMDHRQLFASHIRFAYSDELMAKSIVASYAQLCFDTDGLIDRLANFFDFNDEQIINKVKIEEHPSMLVESNNWIGGKWQGADVFPGRARVELKSETFIALTNRYKDVLAALKKLDDPRFEYFYSN